MEQPIDFNSNVLETYLYRINGLAEQFVSFHDDMFLVRPTGPEYFFQTEKADPLYQ